MPFGISRNLLRVVPPSIVPSRASRTYRDGLRTRPLCLAGCSVSTGIPNPEITQWMIPQVKLVAVLDGDENGTCDKK
jgi:hypothetical protein